MTVGTPAWLNASAGSPTYDAAELRAIDTMYATYDGANNLGARQGVRPGGTSAQLSVATMTWTVATGTVSVSGVSAGAFGEYRVPITAAETGTVPARDATFDRKDIVIVRVYDADNGDLTREAKVEYLTGTPASTPLAPTVPAKSVLLGTITVPKTTPGNALTVTLPTDRYTVASGGVLPTPTRPSVPYSGQVIFNLTSGVAEIYNGTTWLPLTTGAPDIQTFAANGTWTKPAGAVWVEAEVIGGGGAGGGTVAGSGQGEGGYGGGGGYARKRFLASDLGTTETITIGNGGAGASGAIGGTGGTSSLRSGSFLWASGGTGGAPMTVAATGVSNGGAGGAGGGGDVNLTGERGSKGRVISSTASLVGTGGASAGGFGPGAGGLTGQATGNAGDLYGGGGGGAFSAAGAFAGGAGGKGYVVVRSYFS